MEDLKFDVLPMRQFDFNSLPKELQELVIQLSVFTELCKFEDNGKFGGTYEFKVLTAADPEWGNAHVPLAVYLVKHGAKKGEVVEIIGA